jgi:hypothetical protein
MKTRTKERRHLIDLGSAVQETKGAAGKITDDFVLQPSGGLGIQ